MAGNRVLLESGEFTSPSNAKGRSGDVRDPKELLQAKSDLAQAKREKAASDAQVERLNCDYRDLKVAYDKIWAELKLLKDNEIKKDSLEVEKKAPQKKK